VKTRTRKLIKWTAFSILGLFGLFIAALIIILAFGITLNLNGFRPSVERAVSGLLDRNVSITGSVSLEVSLRPTLEIHGVQIDNPESWDDPVFASMEMARVQIGLWPLLSKQIDIGEITAKKVSLNLHTNEQGENNWHFGTPTDDPPQEPEHNEPKARTTPEPSKAGLQALDELSLQELNIRYRDDSLDKELVFRLDELAGTAARGQPLKLKSSGSFQEKSYRFAVEAGALDHFHPRRQLFPLSITGEVAGSPFTAKGSMGRDDTGPKLDLDSTLSKVDIGALLEWLNLAEEIDAQTDELALHLKLRGDSLHKLLTQSNATISLKGGRWTLHGTGKGAGLRIAITEGSVSALAGEPVSIDLDGVIDETPVNIGIQGMELVKYVQNPEQLPITIKAQAAGAMLDFRGELAMPSSSKNFSLAMTFQGEKLDTLNELLNLDLPPIGPYSVGAQFSMKPQGYDLSDLKIKVGTSDLTGHMVLSLKEDRPDIEAQLASNVLQIDDFALSQWSPERETTPASDPKAESEPKEDASKIKQQADQQKVLSLLSPEAMSRANAHLSVNLDKVMSGKDNLGKGNLEISLQDGRFIIEPLELELPEGTARTEFSYYPTTETAEIHLAVTVDGLDVGVLARRAKPETKMGGRLDLDILLDATAPSIKELMANGAGHFDLGFSPENFDARIIDLWAVSLLSALTSEVDSEPTSIINCLVASFEMADGVMQDRIIFLDTTRMSVEGTAVIDFKKQHIDLQAKPKAKKPEFFSIAIPVEVSGDFDDFGIGVKPGHIIRSVGNFITSPVHVPLRRLISDQTPEDTNDACRIAWERRNQED
jgi:uncharacterized protein involved in outer membrane biogenesis